MINRRIVNSALTLLLLVVSFAFSLLTANAAGIPWYVGVAAGPSFLKPDTRNSGFSVDSDVSFGAGVFGGVDLTDRFSIELGYSYLGKATLSNQSGETDIGYAAVSAGALWYLFGDANDIAERNGFSGFLRLGVNAMSNQHSIPLEREDNTSLWLGAGVEWPFNNNLNLRAELNTFDGDAQAARVSVLYRPRVNSRNVSAVRAPRPTNQTPAPTRDEPQARQPGNGGSAIQQPETRRPATPQLEPAPRPPAQSSGQNAAPSVATNDCVAPAQGEPVNSRGCALFSGPLRGAEFAQGTATLTSIGAQRVDQLAALLKRYPNIVIEIQAHSESFGNPAQANAVTRQRAVSIARRLASSGVPVQRLRARAFGSSQPVASEQSAGGRRLNNRIELRVLAR